MELENIVMLQLSDLAKAADQVAKEARNTEVGMLGLIDAMREYNQAAASLSGQSIPTFIREEATRYSLPTREALERVAQIVERNYF